MGAADGLDGDRVVSSPAGPSANARAGKGDPIRARWHENPKKTRCGSEYGCRGQAQCADVGARRTSVVWFGANFSGMRMPVQGVDDVDQDAERLVLGQRALGSVEQQQVALNLHRVDGRNAGFDESPWPGYRYACGTASRDPDGPTAASGELVVSISNGLHVTEGARMQIQRMAS